MSQMKRARTKKKNREHKTKFCRPECFYASHPFPLSLAHPLAPISSVDCRSFRHIYSFFHYFSKFSLSLCDDSDCCVNWLLYGSSCSSFPFNNKANFIYVCTFEGIMFGLLVNITIYDATTIHTYMHLFVFASERKKEASDTSKPQPERDSMRTH